MDHISADLGIPWQREKDHDFAAVVPFTGFIWDLEAQTVSIAPQKAQKYIHVIDRWLETRLHTLREVQQLHGKLWHASLVVQSGRAYLTTLESMLGVFHDSPFMPRTPPKSTVTDLLWWRSTLRKPVIAREIPGPREVWDPHAFLDASSGVGLAIVIKDCWRAWRLLLGWKSDGRDISWAKAVAMELLVRTIILLSADNLPLPDIKVFGDNRGVVEGWWKGCSRSRQTNFVFHRLVSELEERNVRIHTCYVESDANPADEPSQGKFPPHRLLLPPVDIPQPLRQLIVDFDAPLAPAEGRAQAQTLGTSTPIKLPLPAREARRRRLKNHKFENVELWHHSY